MTRPKANHKPDKPSEGSEALAAQVEALSARLQAMDAALRPLAQLPDDPRKERDAVLYRLTREGVQGVIRAGDIRRAIEALKGEL